VTQIGGAGADAPTIEERQAIEEWAARLSPGQVHRLWQLLLKGHEEVRAAPDPLVSAQMALLRMLHAADLPDPGALAKQLGELAASGAGQANGAASNAGPAAALDWRELCDKVERAGMLRVAGLMRDWVRVIDLTSGRLVFSPAPGLSDDPAAELRDALLKATGERWQVERGEGEGVPSLREQADAAKASEAERIRRAPLVEAALAAFPEAEFVDDTDPPKGERSWSRH
jgi:DNA polymerase-3 subunit gamma/tau